MKLFPLVTAFFVLSSVIFTAVGMCQSATGFEIVNNGRAQAVIVLPAKPSAVERYAAQELAEHIEKSSSVKLPVELESQAAPAARRTIYIGRTQAFQQAVESKAIALKEWRAEPLLSADNAKSLPPVFQSFPPNGFLLKTVGNSLFLAGRDDSGQPLNDTVSAGTLFAVYEWLEGQIGVRWVWPGELGTLIPKKPSLSSGQWDSQGQPPLLSTKLRRDVLGKSVFTPTDGGFTPEQRQQVMQEETVWYRRNRFARSVNIEYGGHAFEQYWKRFSASNPEYFNLLPDGKRRPAINERVVSMSVSNPGLHRQIITDWQASRTVERPWVNAIENDTSGMCVCDECLAWDVVDPNLQVPWERRVELAGHAFKAEERQWYRHLGSLSDRYARYYLAVQKLARETDPQAKVIAYAYLNYRNPPLATKLNRDIVIGIIPEAPAPLSYLWPLNDQTYTDFEKQWKGWSETGASLYLRPNYLISGHNQPLVFPKEIARYFRLAYQHNLVATDYDSLTRMWATQGPNLYVASRLHWKPTWTVEQVLDEYYSLFGPASKEVQAYFEFWEAHTKKRGEEMVAGAETTFKPHHRELFWKWSSFYSVSSLLFTAADFARAEELLNAAKQAADNDELALKRLDFLGAGLEDAKLVAKASAIDLQLAQTGDISAMSKAVAALDAHRTKLAQTYPHALNMDLLAYNENRSWERLLYLSLAQGNNPQKLTGEWSLRWDVEKQGQKEAWYNQPGDTALWQKIEVTRPWEKLLPGQLWRKEHGTDYDGWAWYRVNFNVDAKQQGSPLHLLFGAVDESATVYVNGRKVGARPFVNNDDWRTPFFVDISDAVKVGEANQLTVLVEDKSGSGGIWKPVWLIEK